MKTTTESIPTQLDPTTTQLLARVSTLAAKSEHDALTARVLEAERAAEDTLRTIEERAHQELVFNVMPERPVREDLHVTHYRVGRRYAEAHFSREYKSAMKKSPSHLIFISAQVQTQKLIYLAMCEEFGFEYVPGADELLKVWPTRVDVSLPRMVRDEDGLIQKLSVTRITAVQEGIYSATFEVTVSGMINLTVDAKIYIL